MMKTFRQSPYYDDYDENKKFYRILFRPSMALQCREINQMQTIIQNQIKRFGDNIFKNGSKVIDGQLSFDTTVRFIRLKSDETRDLSKTLGLTYTGEQSGVVGKVVAYEEASGDDPYDVIIVSVQSSGETTLETEFAVGEELNASDATDSSVGSLTVSSDTAEAVTGSASIAHIERGVYYIYGYFVLVDEQTIILNKYNNRPTYRVGLDIVDSFVTPEDDETLLDNAIDSYNYTAPGAHRYMIDLRLTKVLIGSDTDDSFVELGQIQSGRIVKLVQSSDYNELADTLAERTYDESGDYTVTPFTVSFWEHRSNNRGEWEQNTKYLRGDVVKNSAGVVYIARNNGTSGSTAPTHTEGSEYEGGDETALEWEVLERPKETDFNDGLYDAKGTIARIEVEEGGAGYTAVPTLNIVGGGGSGAQATAIIAGGEITGAILDNAGQGYDNNDTLAVEVEPDQGAKLTATALYGDDDLFVADLSGGRAYVRGYRIDKVGNSYLPIPKARTYVQKDDVYVACNVGAYVRVMCVNGIPDFSTVGTTVTLRNNTYVNTTNGTVIGSAKVKGFEKESGSSDVYRLYLYDIKMNSASYGFSKVTQIGTSGTNLICLVDPILTPISGSVSSSGATLTGVGSLFLRELSPRDVLVELVSDGVGRQSIGRHCVVKSVSNNHTATLVLPSGTTQAPRDCFNENESAFSAGTKLYKVSTNLVDASASSLLFQLPDSYIKATRDGDGALDVAYTVMSRITSSNADSGQFTFNVPNGGYFDSDTSGYIFADQNGNIVDATPTVAKNATSFTVAQPSSAVTAMTCVAPIVKTDNNVTTAGAIVSAKTPITITTDPVSASSSINLSADTFRIIKVIGKTSKTDYTDRYELDYGQTEVYYGTSRAVLKTGATAPSEKVTVTYEYFDHGTGDFFTIDSYPENIDPKLIPTFNGVSLRNCIDFRKKLGASNVNAVKAGSYLTIDYSYYQGRKDLICVDYQGNFIDVQGVPSDTPEYPAVPQLCMPLYRLNILPMTETVDAKNVQCEMIDNRRYTMRDIGKLEKRINTLEEYTTLNMLEQQTASLNIVDSDGNDRFTEGFAVDNFKGIALANPQDTEYNAAMDMENGICRPPFSEDSIDLIENTSGWSYVKRYGKVYTLARNTDKLLVSQLYASRTESVNPYAVATFFGSVTVNPASDDWYETKYLPQVVNKVEGNYLESKKGEGIVWNNWQTSWTGKPVLTDSSVSTSTERNYWNDGWGSYTDVTSTETTQKYAQQIGQTRAGIKTTVTSRIDYQEVGDKLVSTSTIPYLRSRYLLVQAKNLKPFTKFTPFFDGVDVSYWCTPASRIQIEMLTPNTAFDTTTMAGKDITNPARLILSAKDSLWEDKTEKTCLDVGDVIRGESSNVTAVVVGISHDSMNNKDYLYVVNIKTDGGKNATNGNSYNTNGKLTTAQKGKTFTANETIIGSLSGAKARVLIKGAEDTRMSRNQNHIYDPIATNWAGEMFFLYWIPNGDKIDYSKMKSTKAQGAFTFLCGDRTVSVSDGTTEDDAKAECTYSAVGVLKTRQKTINAVRNANVVTAAVNQNRTLTNSWSTNDITKTEKAVNLDPLSETFLVQNKGGAFISKVLLYFASVDPTLPVTVQIRSVVNGYPSNEVLAFAEVTKRPEQINLSSTIVSYSDENGVTQKFPSYDTPTEFVFPSPVYVEDNVEYAITILSNSNKYRVWIAEVGDIVPTTKEVISKQPYNGVLFKSQNGTTWTAEQNQDLKFELYRCDFVTGVNANLSFKTPAPSAVYLDSNPFNTTAGAKTVTVTMKGHGFANNDRVTLSRVNPNGSDSELKIPFSIKVSNTTVSKVSGSGSFVNIGVGVGDQLYTSDDTFVGTVSAVSDTLTLEEAASSLSGATGCYVIKSIGGIPAGEFFGKSYEVSSATKDSFVVTASQNATATGDFGGDYAMSTRAIPYDIVQPTVNYQTFSETPISFWMKVTNENNIGTEQGIVTVNDNNYFTTSKKINAAKNAVLNVTMSTTNSSISPVIDSERVSLITVKNEFDNSTSSPNAQYVTKEVRLTNVSTYLKVMFAYSLPMLSTDDKTNLVVSYKAYMNGNEPSDWTVMTPNSDKLTNTDINSTVFYDGSFTVENISAFDTFKVKIAFVGENTCAVPKIEQLRILACE